MWLSVVENVFLWQKVSLKYEKSLLQKIKAQFLMKGAEVRKKLIYKG